MIGVVIVGLLLSVGCWRFWSRIPLFVEHSEWVCLDALRAEEAKRQGEDQ